MTNRVLGLVQAGGQGSRMDVLTRERAKPALPFAGSYQLIDFALSSLAHSTISDVWVSVQYQAGSLDPHLAGGRPWDLDRTRGGYRRVVPEQGDGSRSESGFSLGNADALLRMRDQIEAFGADQVVVISADHVFRCDLDAVLALHREREAECTIVTAEMTKVEAAHQAVVTAGADGHVTGFDYKPTSPASGVVATEVFVYDAVVLLESLDALRADLAASGELDEDGLGDFGEHLLPRLVGRGQVWAAPIGGYWRDVGRPESFLQAHRDLLAGRVDVFDDADRPVLTRFPELPPALVRKGAQVVDSLVSPGCDVAGEVVRSVLGPGVKVAAGARVEDSVLFAGVVVEGGASVATSVLDSGVVVGQGAVVGALSTRRKATDDEITLVGRDSRVPRRAEVAAGARLEPGSTA
ncbi:glucose-1-phosphate adenylyltransferase family protein [Pedococcus aerophilus]|uniref:Glucose-1-phosphate adenylyltransferase family protein n=1 Tax=Pedococcus aerophilus TaxID=436356 RepID=A0ABN3USV9_9MICO